MNFLNNVSRQTWAVFFTILGAGLSCWPPSKIAGTILVGGGLAMLEIPKKPVSEEKAKV